MQCVFITAFFMGFTATITPLAVLPKALSNIVFIVYLILLKLSNFYFFSFVNLEMKIFNIEIIIIIINIDIKTIIGLLDIFSPQLLLYPILYIFPVFESNKYILLNMFFILVMLHSL